MASSAGAILATPSALALDLKDFSLKKRLTVAEAEAANMVSRPGPALVPFGRHNGQWLALLAKMQEGDELWEAWMQNEKGVALVRHGEVRDFIVTLIVR